VKVAVRQPLAVSTAAAPPLGAAGVQARVNAENGAVESPDQSLNLAASLGV
jgi:hypothetical protein